ncbi:hypothetical protein pb186bvf_018098 [Paramecium bursaria]
MIHLLILAYIINPSYQACTQLTYQTCMKNTPDDSCVFLNNKCYQSTQTSFGCASSLNKNLCLIQNAKCQYIQKCQSIEQSTLDRIGCEWRLLTKVACTHITQDRCVYIQEESKCKQYLKSPIKDERCESRYGMLMIVSPLLCSQITNKACIWNPSNYLCTSEIQKEARCDELGLSLLACIQIVTDGQKCISFIVLLGLYSRQNKYCKENCPFVCQDNFLDKCDENMNQNACLSVQSEACQFLNGKCQKINPSSCIYEKVNEKTCTIVESQLCIYNPQKLSCEVPSLLLLGCGAQGLNKLACIQLSGQCIFDGNCRTVEVSELFNIQCRDAVSKTTCLAIQTQLQNCQWNKQLNQCQELQINKQTSCTSLLSVNGNSCKSVTKESCKYSKENCVITEANDQCEAPYINLIGCTSILKFQTPCQWINNSCARATVTSDRACDSYTFVNPVVCSLYYKMIEDPEFLCQVDDNFTQFNYTCRYDSSIMSCRNLRKEEFTTLQCGDKSLGLNLYACSLIQTQGQVCIFRASNCIKMKSDEQYQIQCNIIQGNPQSCSYTTYGKAPCKFNLKTCGCLNTIDPKRDKCETVGMNSIGCGQITTAQCYYNTENTKQFQCLPKTDESMQNKLDCVGNSPNQKLCLSITTPEQLCKWSNIKQICERLSIDSTQPCGYFTNVNLNVCTQIQQIEPNINYKGYCYYDTIFNSCKSWSLDRQCTQSCCADQIGINIHICSAMTNFDDSFCFFQKYKCQKHEVQNQLDFLKIQPLFNRNYTCEQFNFKLCGLINPNLEGQFYCYQSSQNDRCQTLLPSIYNQMDKSIFLDSTVRSNVWTCIKIYQDKIKVRYDPIKGKCESITETITCEQHQINKQACLELTKDSKCYWDDMDFQCKEINHFPPEELISCSSIINRNVCLNIATCRFNNILFQCENVQEINSTTQCTSLSQNYSYNQHACKKVTDEKNCSYDNDKKMCKEQTDKIPNCLLFGQNKQSCLSNTQGLCKWNESEYLCMDTIIDDKSVCDSNLNKFACMKITFQNCQFDTQCKQLTQIFTCDQLVDQTKTLLRYFNQRACISLQDNQRCAYDVKNFQCQNFTTDQNLALYNYTCTQFPMNIHLCLSHTRGSYCIYNQTTFQCLHYNYTTQYQNCSTINLNREVCIDSAKSCRFKIQTSTCEDFQYNNQFCSELKADGGYLYGIKVCTKVSNKKSQPRFTPYHNLQCLSYQCNLEYYCTYDLVAGGCDIINYIEASYLKINEQQICQVKKRYLECDSKFNEFICLHLTDVPCYFDRTSFQCVYLDDTNNNIATCETVSAAGCQRVKTKGQFCYIQSQQFTPESCNVGLPQLQICKQINQLENLYVEKPYGNSTYIDTYTYTQSRYVLEYHIPVNANTCGQYEDNYLIYDEDSGECMYSSFTNGCDIQGMSYYLCLQNRDYGCLYNSTYKYCYSNQNNSNTSKKCEEIYLSYSTIQQQTIKSDQSLLCPKNAQCAYYQEKYIRQNTNISCYYCQNNATDNQKKAKDNCDLYYGSNYCSDYYLSYSFQCGSTCTYKSSKKKYNTANPTVEISVNCSIDFASYYLFDCSCLLTNCKSNADTNYNTNVANCNLKTECQKYVYPCITFPTNKNSSSIVATYITMPKDLCLNSLGLNLKYDSQSFTCTQIYSNQNKCSYLNKNACIYMTNSVGLYCTWLNNQCSRIESYEFINFNDCELVNLNACPLINTNCQVVQSSCKSISAGSCDDPQNIKNQLICSQVEQNQCYMNIEFGQCTKINDTSQQFQCSQPGLNMNACLINTNQYCYFQIDKKQCLQITELGKEECSGLNVKGCTEHPIQSCYWNWDTNSCYNVSSPLPNCEKFLVSMPTDYLVNYQTCFKIESACIYQDNKCKTPQNEDGCASQIYNKLGCTQKTNQFCQAIIGQNSLVCTEIGDFNKQCDSTLNYYACNKMVSCIWQNAVCQELNVTNVLQIITQYPVNPFICQNLKQKGTYFYNKINSKCEPATQKIYQCTDQYINQETCLQLTNNFCYYLTQDGVENYRDTTQRCLNYDQSLLFTQACDQNLNYKVCSNLINYACVFKDGKCQSSQNLTCLQLSQSGIYASVQACSQTQDEFCSYDQINQRCKVIDSSTKLCQDQQPCLCDTLGVNQQLCLSSFQNKCEFKTESIQGSSLFKSFCDYAIQSNYTCSDKISLTQCVLILGCQFQNYQCQKIDDSTTDLKICVKGYEIDGLACSRAQDVPCGYDLNTYKCVENPEDNILYIKYFNKLACIKSSIKQSLIFLNGQCQIAEKDLICTDDINLFACTHIDAQQECIFDSNCQQVIQLKECEKSINVNNPITCSKTINNACKFKDYNCVIANDDVSECQYQGLNNLACLLPNLMNCQNCSGLLLNSICTDIKSKNLCLSLNSQCQWITNQCNSVNVQNQTCESLPVGVNTYACYSVNIDNFVDQVCIYDKITDKCKLQGLQSCDTLNSYKTCVSNTKLSCVWLNDKCVQQIPLKNQDYCTTYLGSNEFCKQIERFDAFCELIEGICQEPQYKQENWEKYVNKKACLQQKLKYCFWLNKCICYDGDNLLQYKQKLNCTQDLSFLMCLSIQTTGQYCQFQYGQCIQLILPQQLKWDQFQLVNQNVCTQVEQYPVGYDKDKYSCKILKQIDDCAFPGLNVISCLSDILDYPCIWFNEKCQTIQGKSRLLQQISVKVNAAYCYDSKDPVYFDGQLCQQVNVFTKCEASGLSKAGCLSILSEPCRWISDDEGCINDYPFNQCELNVGMVNAVFCKYVEIGQCRYDAINNSCAVAKFDTWIYSYQDQKCVCISRNCDNNKINEQCILPATLGINSLACTSIQGAIFMNYECQLVNPNSSCQKLLPVNILACKYVIDRCIYDPIDGYCTTYAYDGICEDISISQSACQYNNCHYFDNQCTCKQLAQVKCLTNNLQECNNNPFCYWENGNCKINQCNGFTDNCQSQENCYRRLKNGQQICDYARTCEEVQLDPNIYSICTEVIIDNKPCFPNSQKNSLSPCITLQCQSIYNAVQCTSTNIGSLKFSDYCTYINNQCLPIECNDILTEDICNKRNGCQFIINNNQQICQQFKTCEEITTDYVNLTAQSVCNKMEIQDSNKYIPCAWKDDMCLINPCLALGIDYKICVGAHINNTYVCTLDKSSLTCNVCEVYQKGCDCLNNDQYCYWNTNKSICQSITCLKILDQNICLNRQDCQFEQTCLTKCSYHFNQQYCQENKCYWDSYNSQCAECDINFCEDSQCKNTKCCYYKEITSFGSKYNICYPKCDKVVSSQCNSTCTWLIDLELCVESNTYDDV